MKVMGSNPSSATKKDIVMENEFPLVIWWTNQKSFDEDEIESELPFEVELLSVVERFPNGEAKTVNIRLLDGKKKTSLEFSVPAKSLTSYDLKRINPDRELALKAKDNILSFPRHVWVS